MRELREYSKSFNTLPRGKFTTGGPVVQKPVVTDDSLYVVGERWGLIRLKRDTLEPMWLERLPDGRLRPKHNPDVAQSAGRVVHLEDGHLRPIRIESGRI